MQIVQYLLCLMILKHINVLPAYSAHMLLMGVLKILEICTNLFLVLL
ncbi:267R [Invertebrate iridescent virus Kaz2018]|uniref:267R n=1 Tax=Invertebrate iridescent virus 6 TaxID=176652 RepID=Q91FQ6_IIV6|nr:267R [Invertebrate iridescent virus 6]AAK82128.1 267R [Invertebrate iridescent virus 6]QMS79384.1 hypothetical protein IIV6-T1_262 [Invertebrate iridescent virus 6]QNH08677.1 267R [Invertebrate iridescent virus Kaz2018]